MTIYFSFQKGKRNVCLKCPKFTKTEFQNPIEACAKTFHSPTLHFKHALIQHYSNFLDNVDFPKLRRQLIHKGWYKKRELLHKICVVGHQQAVAGDSYQNKLNNNYVKLVFSKCITFKR